MPFNVFEIYYVIENIMENWYSIIFSKVFKTFLKFVLNFFQSCLKKENDVMT